MVDLALLSGPSRPAFARSLQPAAHRSSWMAKREGELSADVGNPPDSPSSILVIGDPRNDV